MNVEWVQGATGVLLDRTLVFVEKDRAGADLLTYAQRGSRVYWDGVSTNEGYEEHYGGKLLRWVKVGGYSVGLTDDEVLWDTPL